MSFLSAIQTALNALLVHKGRSTLTSLGIVIGVSTVIAVMSAGQGAYELLNGKLEAVGKSMIVVRAGARGKSGAVGEFVPLTPEDALAIRRRLGSQLLDGAVAELQSAQRLAVSQFGKRATTITGATPECVPIRKWTIKNGRFFNDSEVTTAASVCVLGQTVRKTLFPNTANPRNQWIHVDQVRLRVIGVLDEKGRSPLGVDQDDQIFVPLSTLQQKIAGLKKASMIMVAAKTEEDVEPLKEKVVQVLRETHRLQPGEAENFDVSSVQEMAELGVILTQTMQLLTVVVALISLLVGGIGIMNIMLVSVTERTREIGIRMAVGARPGDILFQFLIEAMFLSLGGGLLGMSMGLGLAVSVALLADWPLVVQPLGVAAALIVSAGVGIFFGYYPALKASRLDPIEALRYE